MFNAKSHTSVLKGNKYHFIRLGKYYLVYLNFLDFNNMNASGAIVTSDHILEGFLARNI